jgi:uncharacterized protein YqhQ
VEVSVKKKLSNYGGQAVLEGVMMRGQKACAIAVRAPDQSILIENRPLGSLYQGLLAKIPFLRGILLLADALILGMRALSFSANVQADEDEQVEGATLVITLLTSLAAGIGLFFLLPAGIAHLFSRWLDLSSLANNLVEGLARLGLLVGYVWGIGFIPEIRRVYGYHGAEHKTINAFEAGANLDVDTVSRYSREHPRCGTAFLLTVVFFSIIIFSLIGPLPLIQRMVSRVLMVPLLAMLAYEYMKLTSRWIDSRWIRLLLAPNLALQRLTTHEPDLKMVEVAIAAFDAMRLQEDETASAD